MYKYNIELKKASMAFELKNGETLLICKEDVNQIASQLICEMMINNQNHIHIHRGSAIEKCNLLYKAVVEQKMSKAMREKYLLQISELIESDKTTSKTLEQEVNDGGKPLEK